MPPWLLGSFPNGLRSLRPQPRSDQAKGPESADRRLDATRSGKLAPPLDRPRRGRTKWKTTLPAWPENESIGLAAAAMPRLRRPPLNEKARAYSLTQRERSPGRY